MTIANQKELYHVTRQLFYRIAGNLEKITYWISNHVAKTVYVIHLGW